MLLRFSPIFYAADFLLFDAVFADAMLIFRRFLCRDFYFLLSFFYVFAAFAIIFSDCFDDFRSMMPDARAMPRVMLMSP